MAAMLYEEDTDDESTESDNDPINIIVNMGQIHKNLKIK
jgi:hypothetical protein